MAIVAVQKSEYQAADPLDTLSKALNIAQSVYGIKTAYEQGALRDLQMEREKHGMESDKLIMQKNKLQNDKDELGFTLVKEGKILESEFNKDYYGMDDSEVQRFNKSYGQDVFLPKVKIKIADPSTGETRQVTAVSKAAFEKAIDDLRKIQQIKATAAEKAADRIDKATKESKVEGKPTAGTFVAAGFADRIADANFMIDELEKKGFDRSESGTALRSNVLNKFGEFGEAFKDEDLKLFDQAKRNFINAVLRRESGAAIAADEFASADLQYFPVAGDTPKTLEQKRLNRARAYESLKREADYGLTGQITGTASGKTSILPAAKTTAISDKKPTDPKDFTDWYLNQ